ncbi:hypothetical protein H920_18442 [Fukomys damarensis]|uniref:Uncharacterized protein n=1 Tax=Fukomys damarensis TaxID=885580 RepID=A0A091DBI2_FUKDA|nr:hypothetical protein H920_18442 [Fukomys damarensis]
MFAVHSSDVQSSSCQKTDSPTSRMYSGYQRPPGSEQSHQILASYLGHRSLKEPCEKGPPRVLEPLNDVVLIEGVLRDRRRHHHDADHSPGHIGGHVRGQRQVRSVVKRLGMDQNFTRVDAA